MKLKIFKYWLKLRGTDNCIIRACYEDMVLRNDKWIMCIKEELERLGVSYLWESNIADNCTYKIIEQRMTDIYRQNIFSFVTSSSKGQLYQYVVNDFVLQRYLTKPIDDRYRRMLTKIRLSNHQLKNETGRYNNTLRSQRICTLCACNDIEDEFHFILKCPFYENLRSMYIKKYYYVKPSVFKVVCLMSSENVKELSNLGKFLYKATALRQSNL